MDFPEKDEPFPVCPLNRHLSTRLAISQDTRRRNTRACTAAQSRVIHATTTMDDDILESVGGGGGGKRQQHGSKYHRTIQSDGTYLTLRHAFGVEGGIRNNVAFVTVPDPEADGGGLMLGYLLHPVGQQVCKFVHQGRRLPAPGSEVIYKVHILLQAPKHTASFGSEFLCTVCHDTIA